MPATPFLIGENGPVVYLPGWACATIAPVLRNALQVARGQGLSGLAAYDEIAKSMELAAEQYVASSGYGTERVVSSEPGGRSVPRMVVPVATAADRLGVSASYVTRLLRSGELAGEKCDARWFVSSADLERFEKERAR